MINSFNIYQNNHKKLTIESARAIIVKNSYYILPILSATVPVSPHPLRINIGFLTHASIGTVREMHFEVPEIAFTPEFSVHDLQGKVHIDKTPQGLLFQGDFNGITRQECVRCINEFDQPISTQFSELYAFNEKNISDSGLLVPEHGFVDLEPLLQEYLILELSIKPLCRPDCKGLCIECGANLNTTACGHNSFIHYD